MVRTLFTAAFMAAAVSLVVAVPADAASLEPKSTKSAGAKSAVSSRPAPTRVPAAIRSRAIIAAARA
ncbi:MAG: hypothetical protein CTY40_05435 [Hyphomicrobium sp.]|nr:MAG: hypothetical protein CTY40_05435 [Hyphomicrobium sp.]